MQQWKVGAATVTRIEEQLGPGSFPPHQYFTGFEREVLDRNLQWLVPNHYLPEQDAIVTSVHSWLIRTERHTILLDCCSGNHKDRHWWPRFHQLDTPFLQRLADAGVAPEQVDFVMCTHLHADHIGWNTRLQDGRWVPTFRNARYLFSRRECEHWDPALTPQGAAEQHRRIAWHASVLPVRDAGLADLVSGPHSFADCLFIEDAPGHTPGHILLNLQHADGGGVFCGDVIHHPLQLCAPHRISLVCADPEVARQTRRRVLEHCAGTGALLLPTHFGAPHVVRVHEEGAAFRPEFVSPQLARSA